MAIDSLIVGFFGVGALGAAVVLRWSHDERLAELQRTGDAALQLYAAHDFVNADQMLEIVAAQRDPHASLAHFYLALGRYWAGDLEGVERELGIIDGWHGLLTIFPSRVLAAYLRAEIAALRGQAGDARALLQHAERLATRRVRKMAAPLFMTNALLIGLRRDARGFADAVKKLDRSRIGELRLRVLAILGIEFMAPALRDAGEIDRVLGDAKWREPNPLLDAALEHRPVLRGILQQHS